MRFFSSTLTTTIAAGLLAACSGNAGSPSAALPSTGAPGQSASLTPAGKLDVGWVQQDGILYHTPHYMATAKQGRPQVQPDTLLSYGGGPVQVTPKVFLIFWGYTKYGDAHGVKPLLERYSANLGWRHRHPQHLHAVLRNLG